MKILFTGGYTLGSVTPLLAVAEELKRISELEISELATPQKSNPLIRQSANSLKIMWVGTRRGPERKLIEEAGIKFSWIYAPKWRRYFDARNVLVPLWLGCSVVWSEVFLLTRRPEVIVTAGGFVGVPVSFAGWLLRIPILLHNQDARWSVANKLVAPFARKITYALPATVPKRWQEKSVWTGNPVRGFVLRGNKERGLKICGFETGRTVLRSVTEDRPPDIPTILVIGGGTGAKRLNEIVREALPELTKHYNVIHLTGRGKGIAPSPQPSPPKGGEGVVSTFPLPAGEGQGEGRYCAFEFVTHEIADLYAAADVVITRAGMGALTELAALGKPMIIVPLPNTHQEDNARYFENKRAALRFNQTALTGAILADAVSALVADTTQQEALAKHATELVKSDAASQVTEEALAIAKNK